MDNYSIFIWKAEFDLLEAVDIRFPSFRNKLCLSLLDVPLNVYGSRTHKFYLWCFLLFTCAPLHAFTTLQYISKEMTFYFVIFIFSAESMSAWFHQYKNK